MQADGAPDWPAIRTVLCHDWLTGMRGGERVLELLCRAFPDAPLYTLLANPKAVSPIITDRALHTSWLQHVPGITRHYRHLLPLFPAAIGSLHPPQAELLISTSHCVAKSIRVRPGTHHLCYCFTPMRYAWVFQDTYLGRHSLRSLVARPLLAALRKWDCKTAARVDTFVAISKHVQQRIQQYYQREAQVIYPPVDTNRCTPGPDQGRQDFDLIVSALVPYKRIDLAIDTYNASGFPLIIIGTGGAHDTWVSKAKPNIRFVGWQPDDVVLEHYRNCRFLIFPGEEDFGIVPLEAQACGKPVIAFARGGALETILDGQTGMFFTEQEPADLQAAIDRAAAIRWDPASIRRHAEGFSEAVFLARMQACVADCLGH